MAPFYYGRGSTTSRLQPLRGGSLLFTIQFPEIPGTHFIDLGRMSRPWSHPVVLITGPLDWESSALTTRPLLHFKKALLHLVDRALNIPHRLKEIEIKKMPYYCSRSDDLN